MSPGAGARVFPVRRRVSCSNQAAVSQILAAAKARSRANPACGFGGGEIKHSFFVRLDRLAYGIGAFLQTAIRLLRLPGLRL